MRSFFGRFSKIKRKSSFLLAVILVLTSFSSYGFADNEKNVSEHSVTFSVGKCNYSLNGQVKNMDIAPFIENGRLMVPISCVSDVLEAKSTWNNKEKRVVISSKDSEIGMTIGSKKLFKNGSYLREMSTEPIIMDCKGGGRTMIPLSEAAKLLDLDCIWKPETKTVTLSKEMDVQKVDSVVYSSNGVYGSENREQINAAVYIKSQDVTLKNFDIQGDLYICEEVGTGDVTLNNINVSGKVFVNGGGKNSVHINGGVLEEIIVGKTSSNEVRIVTSGVNPKLTIAKEAENQRVIVEGSFDRLDLNAQNVKLDTLGSTLINEIVVSEQVKIAELSISENTTVESVVANKSVEIKNRGKIKNKASEKQQGTSTGSKNSNRPSKPVDKGAWLNEDFIIEGQVVKGFSEKGLKKFETNKNVVIPKYNGSGQVITEIGDSAFEGKISEKQNSKLGINTVDIPNTVTVIGKSAFRYQALTDIKLPKNIKTIKMSAFNGNKLKKLVIPDSLTELEAGAFTLNEIEHLKLSKSLERIPTAFGYNKLEKLVIPEGVKRIDDLAFSDNDLVEVSLPNSLEYLSGFNNNAFESFTIPSGVKELGKSAIARNKIGKITIPKNVRVIGEGAFRNTWHDKFLTEVIIEEGLEKIERNAFNGNHLTDVNIPNSVVSINESAFVGNTGYDGTVHLYTKDYKNINNLKDCKNHVIDPAKLTLVYKFKDEVLKTEDLWKQPSTDKYFLVGETIKIKPELKDPLYELESTDDIEISFKDKHIEFNVPCKAKAVSESVYLSKVVALPSIVLDKGVSANELLKNMEKKTKIIDSRGKEYTVNLVWNLEGYDSQKEGSYEVKASFKLPSGVIELENGAKSELKLNIIIKEASNNTGKWDSSDFEYNGTVISGFSKNGETKFASNKDIEFALKNTEGNNITGIAKEAFRQKGIKKVIFPEGISNFVIGSAAFEKNEIEYVYFPMGMKEIDTYSFNENRITYVEIPDSVKKIGNHTFANNNIVSLKFGEGVEGIALDRFSFRNNNIVSTTILKQVKKVHGEAFMGNIGFADDGNRVHIFTTSFDPNDDNNNWFGSSDYHRVIPMVNNSASFEISNGIITKYLGNDKDVVIPKVVSGQNVIGIADKVFYKKGLESVQMPDSIETIGKVAFGENKLKYINLPYELKSIDMNAFAKNQIEYIGFGEKLESIASGAFANNKIKVLEIPNSVTEIGQRAFNVNEIEVLKLSSNMNQVAGFTFYKNKIKQVEIPEGITSIESAAFKENSIEKLILPSTITKIDCGAFMGNKLSVVDITENANEICENAFDEGVIINKIKQETEFWKVEDFIINGWVIEGFSESGSVKLSENKDVKLPITNKDGQNITEIGDKAFAKKELVNVIIPDSVETIGMSAFGDNLLTEITLPKNLKTIKGAGFAKNKLTKISFGNSLESIGMGAFSNNELDALVIPDTVTIIESKAFLNNKITSLSFSGNIKELSSGVFSKNKLTNLVIPSGVEMVGRTAFSENEITELIIPDTVVKIDCSAFIKNKIIEVTIPAKTEVCDNSFDATVKVNKTVEKEALVVAEEAPVVIEEAPAVIEEAPAVVEETPVVIEEAPAVA